MKDDSFSLTPALLLNAYAAGIFPMAESRDDPEIYWVDPRRRGVLPLEGLHLSRSLKRRMRRGGYTATLNADFAGVLAGCAARDETWISAEIHSHYTALHSMGHAHSLEVWEDGELAGGVYGVALQSAFFGESMFSARSGGSKLALVHLVDHLRHCGFTLFDTQFITPHLESLGAQEISRAAYHLRLEAALARRANIHSTPFEPDIHSVMHRMTHTS